MRRAAVIACLVGAVVLVSGGPAGAGPPYGSGPSTETPAIDQPPGCTLDQGAEGALGDVVASLPSGHPALFEVVVAQQDVRLFCFRFGENPTPP